MLWPSASKYSMIGLLWYILRQCLPNASVIYFTSYSVLLLPSFRDPVPRHIFPWNLVPFEIQYLIAEYKSGWCFPTTIRKRLCHPSLMLFVQCVLFIVVANWFQISSSSVSGGPESCRRNCSPAKVFWYLSGRVSPIVDSFRGLAGTCCRRTLCNVLTSAGCDGNWLSTPYESPCILVRSSCAGGCSGWFAALRFSVVVSCSAALSSWFGGWLWSNSGTPL